MTFNKPLSYDLTEYVEAQTTDGLMWVENTEFTFTFYYKDGGKYNG